MRAAELDLDFKITSQDQHGLTATYRVENRSDSAVYLFNQLYRLRQPTGVYVVEPNLVYTTTENGALHLAKWVPEIPEDVSVEYPIIPCATLLQPRQSFSEEFQLQLPAVGVQAYAPPRPALPGERPVVYQNIKFSLGYFKQTELGPRQATKVRTTQGEAYHVTLTAPSQRIVTSAPLERPVPVLPDSWQDTQRRCPHCGATNLGPQGTCLVCQRPLPPLTARPQAAATKTNRCPNPQCGQPLPPGKAFCTACGQQVDQAAPKPETGWQLTQTGQRCPNPQCGQPIPAGKKFCTACGTRLS